METDLEIYKYYATGKVYVKSKSLLAINDKFPQILGANITVSLDKIGLAKTLRYHGLSYLDILGVIKSVSFMDEMSFRCADKGGRDDP